MRDFAKHCCLLRQSKASSGHFKGFKKVRSEGNVEMPHLHVRHPDQVLAVLCARNVIEDILDGKGNNTGVRGCPTHCMSLATARLSIGEDGAVETSNNFFDQILCGMLVDGLSAPAAVKYVVEAVPAVCCIPTNWMDRVTLYPPGRALLRLDFTEWPNSHADTAFSVAYSEYVHSFATLSESKVSLSC